MGIKEGPKEPIKNKDEEQKENPKKREVKAEDKKKEPAKKQAPPKKTTVTASTPKETLQYYRDTKVVCIYQYSKKVFEYPSKAMRDKYKATETPFLSGFEN